MCGLSSCPKPGMESMFTALQGELLTTGSPRKSLYQGFYLFFSGFLDEIIRIKDENCLSTPYLEILHLSFLTYNLGFGHLVFISIPVLLCLFQRIFAT